MVTFEYVLSMSKNFMVIFECALSISDKLKLSSSTKCHSTGGIQLSRKCSQSQQIHCWDMLLHLCSLDYWNTGLRKLAGDK